MERVALYWGSAPTVCDGTSRQPRVGVATRPPVTFRVVDAAAEVAVDRIPDLLGKIEGLPDDAQPDDGSLDPWGGPRAVLVPNPGQ